MTDMSDIPDHVVNSFLHFAEICEDQCPLYALLATRITQEPEILAIAAHHQKRQPAVNMLFGSVLFLLLSGVEHPLRSFYATLGGSKPATEAWPVFLDFCRVHKQNLIPLVTHGRVQTNEIGRCGLLMPALAAAYQALGASRPLHLIEVGASAGLNLLFDRYQYRYSNGITAGPDSPVVIQTELVGDHPPHIPDCLPPVTARVGIDIAPIDVMDEAAMQWVEALIWPDESDRVQMHRAARQIAQTDPPTLIAGDGLELVPQVLADVSPDAIPCIYHSHAVYQMPKKWRADFDARLNDLGAQRDLAYVSLEWLDPHPGPRLEMSLWHDGTRTDRLIATCHHHGRWLVGCP